MPSRWGSDDRYLVKAGKGQAKSAAWAWNGDLERPTVTPSLLCNGSLCRCPKERRLQVEDLTLSLPINADPRWALLWRGDARVPLLKRAEGRYMRILGWVTDTTGEVYCAECSPDGPSGKTATAILANDPDAVRGRRCQSCGESPLRHDGDPRDGTPFAEDGPDPADWWRG